MSAQALRELVSAYLTLLRTGHETQEQNEVELDRLLDSIAAARHGVQYTFDNGDDPDAPDWSYEERRALVAKRFPAYGYYNVAIPVSERLGDASCSLGDAIDDIADIAGDLGDVEWYWAHTSENNALWHFQQSFQCHWGQHLRELQTYLHALRSGG